MKRRLIKTGDLRHTEGVYGIYYMQDGERNMLYIGSGDVADCYNRHDSNIRYLHYKGKNKQIMCDLFHAGVDLYFTVLEECTKENKLQIETKYLKLYRKTICNSDSVGKCRSSQSTPEEKERRRQANAGENNPHCTKFTEEDVRNILYLLYIDKSMNRKQVAKMFDTSTKYLSQICTGTRWLSVVRAWEKEYGISIITKNNGGV